MQQPLFLLDDSQGNALNTDNAQAHILPEHSRTPYGPLRVSRVYQPHYRQTDWNVFSRERGKRSGPQILSPVVTLSAASSSSILFAKKSSETF
jgi:hypothetical protein